MGICIFLIQTLMYLGEDVVDYIGINNIINIDNDIYKKYYILFYYIILYHTTKFIFKLY